MRSVILLLCLTEHVSNFGMRSNTIFILNVAFEGSKRFFSNIYLEIKLGNCLLNDDFCLSMLEPARLIVVDSVMIDPHVLIDSINHILPYYPSLDRGDTMWLVFYIKEGAWTCLETSINQRVRIGLDTVVAAGAVVTQDVPAETLVSGVTASEIKMTNTPCIGE